LFSLFIPFVICVNYSKIVLTCLSLHCIFKSLFYSTVVNSAVLVFAHMQPGGGRSGKPFPFKTHRNLYPGVRKYERVAWVLNCRRKKQFNRYIWSLRRIKGELFTTLIRIHMAFIIYLFWSYTMVFGSFCIQHLRKSITR